jgi:alpha-1,2-glucosyltransferase
LPDYGLLLLTVVISALRKPLLVLQVALPYLILLGLFAGFVLWNGSVVLGKQFEDGLNIGNQLTTVGDKSAHTATIHLPQMLYFWPYIAFFSAPLVIGPVLHEAVKPLPIHIQAMIESSFLSWRVSRYPDLIILVLFIVGATMAVHFNTIIHPYTLADNRHYVFYVFRILRQHPAIRYLAVPAYYTCAWLVTHAISALPNGEQALKQKRPKDRPTRSRTGSTPCQISFITIWLVTTALSVVTAPLVEPRYFIVPWIIWRLHVPSAPASLSSEKPSNRLSYDIRLGLETLWLLTVDAAVMYVFLNRGFAWPSEPDKIQRFLW